MVGSATEGSCTEPLSQVDLELSRKLEGYKYFELLQPVLSKVAELRPGADREWKAVHHLTAYLFYFFNPAITSLRGLQHATQLPDVQRKLKIPRVSLGTFSEAASKRVFDAELLAEVLRELVGKLHATDPKLREKFGAVKHVLTATDGTLLKAVPRMAWALWLNETKRAAKAHVQFEVVKGVGVDMELTPGNSSEREVLADRIEAGRCYIVDRGYVSFSLFQKIIDIESSFVCRLGKNIVVEVIEEREIPEVSRKAGVVSDQVVRLGGPDSKRSLKHHVRVVTIARDDGKSMRLATSLMDIDADLVGEIYGSRWTVELFFRWLKCILGCTHLISEQPNGVALQVYAALIASVLIALWTGTRPNKRMFELICFYFQGWASFGDVEKAAAALRAKAQQHTAKST